MRNDFVVEYWASECGKSGDLAFVTIFPKAKRTGDGLIKMGHATRWQPRVPSVFTTVDGV